MAESLQAKTYPRVIKTVSEIYTIIDICKNENCEFYALTEMNEETVSYLLGLNIRNRNVVQRSKNALKSDVKDIGYHCVALMSVSSDGRLINGQHRLMVIQEQINSGKWTPEVQMIQFGLERKWNDIVDSGSKRKTADTLIMNGVDISKYILSGCSVYIQLFENNNVPTAYQVRKEYESRFFHINEIGDMVKNKVFAGVKFKLTSWQIACFRIIQEAYGTENAQKVYNELFESESTNSPMGAFRTYYTSGKMKILQNEDCRKIGREANVIRNGYFFNMAKKCVQGIKTVQSVRSSKLGVTIRGVEF